MKKENKVNNELEKFLALESILIIKDRLLRAFILINFFGVFFAIFSFNSILFIVITFLIFIVDIWILYLRINTESKRILYELFYGIYFVIFSVICIIAYNKFIYLYLKISSPLYAIFSIFLYLLFLGMAFYFKINSINQGSKRKNRFITYLGGFAGVSGLLGMCIGRLILSFGGDKGPFILSFFILGLAYAWIPPSLNIYKYYLLKKTPQDK